MAKGSLGGNEYGAATLADRFAENFLGLAARINVSRVEEINACVEANVQEAGGFLCVGAAPSFEEFAFASECTCAKTEYGNFESRIAELSIFHRG